ncbi:MAP7 domain-containing protein [Tenacibaculum crassostreae]|uniref:MAP7 domain-containing protein n=1 Tax=Tenacibaculum crassostreae TaxID=502683 RepID=UPI0038955521
MTFKQFKISIFLLLVTTVVSAQKYDKKISENFNTNKDVEVKINASNAEIDVTTWNKNEVSIEAIIEVEGLDKKEAQKYLDNWKFEALGNKSKVQINANRSSFHSLGNDNIVFFNSSENNFPKVFQYNSDDAVIVVPEMPEIPEIPELPEIVIPEINFEEIVTGLENIEFDFDKYAKDGGDYFFHWKDGVNDITIKSKKEWEEFKKTDKYKEFKKHQEERKKEIQEELKRVRVERINQKELRKEMAKARAEIRKINREEIKRELANARKEMAKARKEMQKNRVRYSFATDSNNFTVNGKKVKVTKKIIVKVPKNATFDLNTRHCKVTLPKTKASGKVSYGTFKADAIDGGKLTVSYSPVNINSLNACTLFLNNVTDAQLASVTNASVNSNSSGVVVSNVYNDVEVKNEFGNLTIEKVHPNYNTLKVFLNYSDAGINSSEIKNKLNFDADGNMVTSKNGDIKFNGDFIILSKDSKIEIDGKYSQLTLKKQ